MDASADFLHFLHRAEPDMRAFIGAMVHDPHAREDLFQEVSRTLWERFDDYDLSRSFGAWARGIAVRKLQETRRRNARFPLLFPPEAMEAVAEAFDETEAPAGEQEAALQLCLEALPERSRHILTLRYDGRQSCEKIAQCTGSSTAAIHQTLSRLRRVLHQCISRRLLDEDFRPVNPESEPATENSTSSPL